MKLSKHAVIFAIVTMAPGLFPFKASAQPAAPRLDGWMTNGPVYDIVHANGITYIGGDFTYITMRTGNGAALSARTATPTPLPRVNGTIHAVLPDGAGGWYVGGNFTTVDDFVRNRLAHILANGTLDLAWNPETNGRVNVMARRGATIYIGGDFSRVDGQTRNFIAALETATGRVTPWHPNANAPIKALSASGPTVYVGGAFTFIGGSGRSRIAALDSATGAATAWNPSVSGSDNTEVSALIMHGATIYAGGNFTVMAGQPRNHLAAVEAATGNLTAWNPNANGPVKTFAASGTTMLVGGNFTIIGGRIRNYIAALEANGISTAWNPNANGAVHTLALDGATLYVGGEFTGLGGENRKHLAAIDASTGNVAAWNPHAGGETSSDSSYVYALAVSGSTVYAGGDFKMIGGLTRNYAAAFNAATGRPIAWDPNANGPVKALAASGATIYAGGGFTNIGGFPRHRIAALEAVTGNATPWHPNLEGAQSEVNVISVSGSTVYVGGLFANIGGQLRNNIAALDAVSGNPTAWNPNANNRVRALNINGNLVYAGGDFTTIGGQSRNYLAAVEMATGNANAWNPNAGGNELPSIFAIAVHGSTVYAGGKFTTIGAQTRHRLAAIEATSGIPTTWQPNVNGEVRCLAISGSTIYLGGEFTRIDGETRNRLAAIDANTGNLAAWNPNATGTSSPHIAAIEVDGSNIFAGGNFTTIGGQPQSYFAHWGEAATNPIPTLVTINPTVGERLQTLNVTFTGANFIPDISSVNAGDGITINSISVTNSTNLTANIRIAAAANTGTRQLSITNSGPGGGTSSSLAFGINNPAPIITSLLPNAGLRGQTLQVAVIGANFINGVSHINFGPDITINSVTFNGAAQMTASITIGTNVAAGAREIIVTNALPGGGTAKLANGFKVSNSVPALTGMAPVIGNRLQTLNVIFTGANFSSGITTLNVGSGITVNSTTVTSSASLIANLTITPAAATGARNFSVSNSEPGGGASASQSFTVNNPAPTLTSITPASGGRGNTLEVILAGTNFIDGVTTINFGPDLTVNSISVNSVTQITANVTIPLNIATGARTVSVTNPSPGGGTSTISNAFTAGNPKPILTSVNPTIGSLGQTLNVDLFGANFINGISSVNFGGGITINTMNVISPAQIKANITIGESALSGPHNVSVINAGPGGGGGTLPNGFAVSSGTIVHFSLPTNLFGSSQDTVKVPLTIEPAGRSIASFDVTINFNPAVLTYLKFTRAALSNDWQLDVSADSGAVNLGAFAPNAALTQTAAVIILHFRVNEVVTPGAVVPLAMSNLAATEVNAFALPISWTDGVFTVSSEAKIGGQLTYFTNNKPLAGDTISLRVTSPAMIRTQISDANGRFIFKALPFGSTEILTPRRMAGNYAGGTITSGDALKAFRGRLGGPEPLAGYENLAADVTGDCQITSGDALAILKRATGSWGSFKRMGLDDWRFVDASFNFTPENWCAAPKTRQFVPLQDKLEENFIGVLLGDVNGSHGAALGKNSGQSLTVTISDPAFAGNELIDFAVNVSRIENVYDSFDLSLAFDPNMIRIAKVALGPMLAPQDWQMDWNAEAGVLRIAGFSMTEAAIKHTGALLLIQASLRSPAKSEATFDCDIPFALFGFNGRETLAQTEGGKLKFTAPQQYILEQNYPNPFSKATVALATVIKYALPQAGMVTLRIYDLLGHVVRTLVTEPQNAGAYTVVWNGRKDDGSSATTGVYLYRLEAGEITKTNKLILQK